MDLGMSMDRIIESGPCVAYFHYVPEPHLLYTELDCIMSELRWLLSPRAVTL